MKLSFSRVRTTVTTLLGIGIAILIGLLVGGLVALLLITGLWGRVPIWMFAG